MRVMHHIDLLSDPSRGFVTFLHKVQLMSSSPGFMSIPVLAESTLGMAEILQCLSFVSRIAKLALQCDGARVVADGTIMAAAVVFDVSETVQRGCFAIDVLEAPE